MLIHWVLLTRSLEFSIRTVQLDVKDGLFDSTFAPHSQAFSDDVRHCRLPSLALSNFYRRRLCIVKQSVVTGCFAVDSHSASFATTAAVKGISRVSFCGAFHIFWWFCGCRNNIFKSKIRSLFRSSNGSVCWFYRCDRWKMSRMGDIVKLMPNRSDLATRVFGNLFMGFRSLWLSFTAS